MTENNQTSCKVAAVATKDSSETQHPGGGGWKLWPAGVVAGNHSMDKLHHPPNALSVGMPYRLIWTCLGADLLA